MIDEIEKALQLISSELVGRSVTNFNIDLEFIEICFDCRILRIFVDATFTCGRLVTGVEKLSVEQIKQTLLGGVVVRFEQHPTTIRVVLKSGSIEFSFGKCVDRETAQYVNTEDQKAYAIIA